MNFIYGVSTDVTKFFSTNLNAGVDYVKANKPVQVAVVAIAVAALAAFAILLKRMYHKYFSASIVLPDNVKSEAGGISVKLAKKIAEANTAGVPASDLKFAKLIAMEADIKKAQENVNAATIAAAAVPADKKAEADKDVANKTALLFNAYKGWEALLDDATKLIESTRATQLEAAGKDSKIAYELLVKRKSELEGKANELKVLVKEFETKIHHELPSITSVESAKKVLHHIEKVVHKIDDLAAEAALLAKKASEDKAYKAEAEAAEKVIDGIYVASNTTLEHCKHQIRESTSKIGYVEPKVIVEEPKVEEPKVEPNYVRKFAQAIPYVSTVVFPVLLYMHKITALNSYIGIGASLVGVGVSYNYDRLKDLVTGKV